MKDQNFKILAFNSPNNGNKKDLPIFIPTLYQLKNVINITMKNANIYVFSSYLKKSSRFCFFYVKQATLS